MYAPILAPHQAAPVFLTPSAPERDCASEAGSPCPAGDRLHHEPVAAPRERAVANAVVGCDGAPQTKAITREMHDFRASEEMDVGSGRRLSRMRKEDGTTGTVRGRSRRVARLDLTLRLRVLFNAGFCREAQGIGAQIKWGSWSVVRRGLVLVVSVVFLAASAHASSALATGRVVGRHFLVVRSASAGRVILHPPGDVYVGTRVHLSGSMTGVTSEDRVLGQVRRGSRWRSIAQTRLERSSRSFSLVWRVPTRAGSVRVRAVIRRGLRVRAVSEVRLLVVVLRPLVLTPSQVVSVPAPGKAGWVTLRSGRNSQGGRARAATVCVPLTQYAQRGQIVAVGWSPQTRAGFLGRINLKGCNGFYASPVPLNQATVNGDTIDWSHPLQVDGNSLTRKTQSSFSQAITNHNLSCNAGTTATLTGTFDAAITPSLKASFSWFRLTSGAFSLTASADASLKLDVQGTAGCTFTKSLPSVTFGTFEVQMGPLPVVVVLQGSLDVDASVKAGAAFDADVAAHAQSTGGISYDQQHGFAPIYSPPTLTFPTENASFTGTAKGHLYVQPAIQALLYGAAGAKVTLSTGLDFNANTSINPWWSLRAAPDHRRAHDPWPQQIHRQLPYLHKDP